MSRSHAFNIIQRAITCTTDCFCFTMVTTHCARCGVVMLHWCIASANLYLPREVGHAAHVFGLDMIFLLQV